jgi:hypothetical protein
MDTVVNLVAAYERLSERVRVTLRTQVGNARGLHDVQMEVRAFCDSAHNVRLPLTKNKALKFSQMRERVPPLDFISLEGSLAKMLDSLQAAERNALEPANPGVQVSFRVAGVRGRPRVEINKNYLEHVLDIRGPYELTDVFKCSARTIRRRAVEYGLRGPGLAPFLNEELPDGSLARRWVSSGKRARSAISSNAVALDTVVASVLATFPGYGQCKVDGALRAQGIRVPRDCLIAAIQRVSGPSARFTRPIIQRRAYYVPAVNSLWHHDGNHGNSNCMLFVSVLINQLHRIDSLAHHLPCVRRWQDASSHWRAVQQQQPCRHSLGAL